MDALSGLIWFVVLLAGNAFFVAAEFSVMSARRSQIEPLADLGKRSAKTALWAMEHATLLLAMCQLGITVCSLLILLLTEPAVHHLVAAPLEAIHLDENVTNVVAFLVTLILVSGAHVVIGEMVPKNLAFARPEITVRVFAPPLVALSRLVRPIIVALNAVSNGVVRLFRVQPRNEAVSAFTLAEVQTIVDHSRREGSLPDPGGRLSAAFEFTEKKVADVAIRLDELVTLPIGATPAAIERAVAKSGFSRFILVDDAGDPQFYVHLKDIIGLDNDELEQPIPRKRLRTLGSVRAESELEVALSWMRASRSHLARSCDQSGHAVGVLFLEDILEVLVGEVRDGTSRW